MPTGAEKAARLVIADTCSILDVLRSPIRHESPSGDVAAVVAVRAASDADPADLAIAVCDVAVEEYARNVAQVEMEVRNALIHLRKQVTHAEAVAGHLGAARLGGSTSGWDTGIIDAALKLTRDLFDGTSVITASDADGNRGVERARMARPPGKRGSVNTFDCIIAECAVRVASSRPALSTYLLTSNTKEFGADSGKRLHPDLVAEFDAAGLVFATTWSEVAGRLGVG